MKRTSHEKTAKAEKTPSFLHALLEQFDALRKKLGIEVHTLRQRPALHAAWGTHVPQMADAGADMLDASPHLARLPLTSGDLRTEVKLLRQLEEMKAQVDAIASDLTDRIIDQKNTLTENVEVLRATVTATIENPLTERTVAAAVKAVSAGFRGIREERVRGMVAARQRTLAERDRGEARLTAVKAERDRLELEAMVLRGGTIQTAPPTAAPRTARRGRKAKR